MAHSLNKDPNSSVLVWVRSPLWLVYRAILDLLENGDCEKAAEKSRELRLQEGMEQAIPGLRWLISARINLKQSQERSPVQQNLLEVSYVVPQAPWLKAEEDFVLGLSLYHRGQFLKGAHHFLAAKTLFNELDMTARSLLSEFNAEYGLAQFQVLESVSLESEIKPLLNLQEKVGRALEQNQWESSDLKKILAMIHRQKAAVLEKNNRLHAALMELDKSIHIFELQGPRSDYHLALLQAANLSLDCEDPKKARAYYEYVMTPVDSRVEFPRAIIQWRLDGKEVDLTQFHIVSPTWKKRYEWLQEFRVKSLFKTPDTSNNLLYWKTSTGNIFGSHSNQKWNIKSASLAGTLVKMLLKGACSKALLVETLWPEDYSLGHLDHRLHQLVSRVNRRVPDLIAFDGLQYRLTVSFELVA